MKILIGCAKDMTDKSPLNPGFSTEPMFQSEATANALQMMRYDEEELSEMLKCNRQIAHDVHTCYLHFVEPADRLQAILAYDGIVFKYIGVDDFSSSDFRYSQHHLLITSFLYGLLRPMDVIKNYRMEGYVELPDNGVSMFDFWKPRLTDVLIRQVEEDGGILLDLASNEMRKLFDWRKVAGKIRVVRPEFRVNKGGRLKTIVIYSKMCRGAMTRYVLKERVETPEQLSGFDFGSFEYSHAESSKDKPMFVMEGL